MNIIDTQTVEATEDEAQTPAETPSIEAHSPEAVPEPDAPDERPEREDEPQGDDEPTEDDTADAEAEAEADALDGIAVVQVNPNEVRVETNVRTRVVLGAAFVRTIKRHGVLLPVLGYFDEHGTIVIRDGQRRILGAIQAERPTVPAYLVPHRDENRLRIIQQMLANAHRESLTDSEEAAALHELTLEGLTPTMIAKELAVKPARVKAAVAVAQSEAATKAVARYEVTFDQALVLAEFEDDAEASKSLRRAAEHGEGDFAHEAQRQRDRKAERQEVEAIVADYTGRGYQQIAWPSYDDKDTVPFGELTFVDGTALTEDNYLGGNGHRFAVRNSWRGVDVGHFVTEWRKWGLKRRKADGTANTPWTDEQKAERRTLIANNKAWASAEVVRREWLARFLSRKTAPKNALAFLADTLIRNGGYLNKALSEHHPLAGELLGVAKREWGKPDPLAVLIEQNPTRTTTVLLAIAIAAHEAATSKSTWRYHDRDDVAYFTALSEWGYRLSDVEGIVLGIEPEAEPEAEPEDVEPTPEPVAPDTDEAQDAEPVEDDTELADAA